MNNLELKGLILRIIWGMTALAAVILLVVYFLRLNRISNTILAKKAEMEALGLEFVLDKQDSGVYSVIGGDKSMEQQTSGVLPGNSDAEAGNNDADSNPSGSGSVQSPVWSSEQETGENASDSSGTSDKEDEKFVNNRTEGEAGTIEEDPADEGSEENGNVGESEEKTDGKTDYVLDPSKPIVALSFDDGPSVKATGRILDVLEKYGVHATFFTVGYEIDYKPELIKREYELGCEVANHTQNHKNLKKLSSEEIITEVQGNADKLKALVPIDDPILRPPYGDYNDTVRSLVNVPLICWSVDSRDWETRNCDKIVAQVQADVRDGYVVLMHDIYETTAEATEILVPWLLEQGYQIASVSEMFAARGEELLPGHVYRKTYPANHE